MPPPRSFVFPYLLLALAVLCWAGNWVVGRALRFDAPPATITFWRWAIALALLLPFTYSYLREHQRLVLQSWAILCLLGLLTTVFQHIPIYIGLHQTTATNGALLNATAPIFILFLAAMAGGEKITARRVFGSLISFGGVLAVISRGDPQVLRTISLNPGDIWVLAATLSWAGYTVCMRWWPSGLDPLPGLSLIAAVGVIASAPMYIWEIGSGQSFQPVAGTFLGIAYIGVFATVIGYIFWNTALQKVGPARAGPFMYLMLVFTPLLSIIFLAEGLHAYHFVGGGLIVSGIIVSTRRNYVSLPSVHRPSVH